MLKSHLKSEETDRLVRALASFGLSPNQWTLLSLVPALIGLAVLAMHSLAAGLICFVISGFIDMVDGAVARTTGRATATGAFIDGVVDRYVELMLYLGLLFYLGRGEFLFLPYEAWLLLLMFGGVMTSFVRAYADHRGLVKDPAELKRMGGFLERGERLLLLYAGMLLGIFDQRWLVIAVIITALLANFTALQRVLFAVQHGKG